MQNANQPITPDVTPTPPPPASSENRKWVMWTLLIIIILTMISATTYYFANQTLKPTPLPSPSEVSTKEGQPTPTPNETVYTEATRSANWKTYSNAQYNFELKYPPNLRLEEYPPNPELTRKVLNIMIDRHGENQLSLHVEKPPLTPSDRYYEYINMKPRNKRIINYHEWNEYLIRPEDYKKGEGLIPTVLNVYLDTEYNGRIYIISSINKTDFNKIQNQILSTFKFLDENTPEKVTENYYNGYLVCLNNHFQNPTGKSPREGCPFDSRVLSIELIEKLKNVSASDSILCAQNTPISIKVDKATISNGTATTTVHAFYSSSDNNPIKVDLQKEDNQWKIINITCK